MAKRAGQSGCQAMGEEKSWEKKRLITSTHHGFSKNKSCQTNVFSFDKVTTWTNKRNVVGIVSFDKALHDFLINKLEKCSLDKTTINWFTNCKQRVIINIHESMSELQEVSSGVSRTLVLCPELFNMFINYLDAGLESFFNKSTHGTKLGRNANTMKGWQRNSEEFHQIGKLG